jgi:hypothetical protein
MKNVYVTYCKEVQGNPTYFVKCFESFPELKNVPDVQVGFGMHPNFERACFFAGIEDDYIINQLKKTVIPPEPAKVIPMIPPSNKAQAK